MEMDVEIEYYDGYRALVAVRDFRQGETICGLPTIALSEPDMYSIEAWPGLHIDCTNHVIGATNHSCDPNAAIRGGAMVAWRCIKAGEEITIDYRRTESELAAPFDCHCGSKHCGGKIEYGFNYSKGRRVLS